MSDMEIKSLRRKIKANLKNAREFKARGDINAYDEALRHMRYRQAQLRDEINKMYNDN